MARAISATSAHGHLLSVSAGVATAVNGDADAFERLIEDADRALYEAKAAGKNRVARAKTPAARPSAGDARGTSRSPGAGAGAGAGAGLGATPSGLAVPARG